MEFTLISSDESYPEMEDLQWQIIMLVNYWLYAPYCFMDEYERAAERQKLEDQWHKLTD
jgi:hypothetical protein